MTIAERKNMLKHFIICLKCRVRGKNCVVDCPTQYDAGNMGEIIENLESISKILEQEPCEDAVSRKAVLEVIDDCNSDGLKGIFCSYDDGERFKEYIKELPSVTPQPKTGHWIEGRSDNPNIHNILCSRCFEGYPSKGHANSQHTKEKFKWCPNCGAYMIGESEK